MTIRSLDSYPRPGFTVDLAILTVRDATTNPQLCVLIQERTAPAGRALPGAFMRERATVAETVDDVLRRKLGLEPSHEVLPRLLRLFDDPYRDSRTWTISAAHAVSMNAENLSGIHGDLIQVTAHGHLADEPPLLFDHDEIVTAAVTDLRERYEFRHRYSDTYPDPDRFLTEPFTLHQLRKVHEAVIGTTLHKDNFNRRMKPFLEPVLSNGRPVLADNLRGRPAALYRHTDPSPSGSTPAGS